MAIRTIFLLVFGILWSASSALAAQTVIADLEAEVTLFRDSDGIPHILAETEHDMVLAQGWAHARDRLFQMDVLRRQASGTLAEILGPAVLASDVELRTIGLRRAAERSLAALSGETAELLQAYAAGVNAFVAAHPLPPEYQALELTRFEPWTALDSAAVAKLLAFGLSFDLDDIDRSVALGTYVAVGDAVGFDGEALFFEDLFRSAPLDPAATVPDAGMPAPGGPIAAAAGLRGADTMRKTALALGRDYMERLRRLPYVRRAVRLGADQRGSNEWAVSGRLTDTGLPMLANDPHLALDTPALFHQIHLKAESEEIDVIGSSLPGAPFVIIGNNRRIAWGATFNPLDVTDVFQEQVVPDPTSPSGLSTHYLGALEPVVPVPATFRANQIGDGIADNVTTVPPGGDIPPVVLIVPRRNDGPVISLDPASGVALSVQYTGFSGTREIETFRAWNRAADLEDFVAGLQSFDVGSENWAYADLEGNIAYFTSAEMPLREDLQAGTVDGLPPFFIRDGLGGNEWLPAQAPEADRAVPYEILPFAEMPQIVNPPAGFFVNANNDPAGTTLDNDPLNQLRPGGGIFYLAPGYDMGSRAGRITTRIERLLADGELISAEDMADIQADVVLRDAEAFVPIVTAAFENAGTSPLPILQALAADPRIAEAVGRLAAWDLTTPTGIPEGYDASDVDGVPTPPGAEEIDSSVAATIYAVWRGRMLANTVDAVPDALGLPKPGDERAVIALGNLFDTFDDRGGVGASGLNFFNVPGVADPADRRDVIVLTSLAGALDSLAGEDFAAAFGNSTNQGDYRWGLLHRIVLDHPLGGPFDLPPALDPNDLPGFAVDGGFETVDAARHDARAVGSNGFMFDSGPTRRFVGAFRRRPAGVDARSSLPGGESGVLGSPFHANLLFPWLTNDTHALRQVQSEIRNAAVEKLSLLPLAETD